MSTSFDRLANKTAQVFRSPASVGGKIGAPVLYLDNLKVVDPWPVDQATMLKYDLKTPRRAFQTMTPGTADILEGDILVIGAARYNIKGSDVRETYSTTHTAIIMELAYL